VVSMMLRRLGIIALLAGGLAIAVGGGASADTWPSRPIRAVLPTAPGTGADTGFSLVFNQL
jgi:tripartite-type tricarboxylate transporter receptor subunit TctC